MTAHKQNLIGRSESDKFFDCVAASLPRTIADHVLIRSIARGSYGEVWLCQNALTAQFRAIKFIWRDAFADSRPYDREYEAIKRFEPVSRSHKGFLNILHTGSLESGFFYIMELADDIQSGNSIDPERYQPATLQAIRDRLSLQDTVRIGIELAETLDVLHSSGLLHRDVKPANIIFVNGLSKLADIGLITHVTAAHSLVGTNGFMAPEGPTSPQADVYSLGKVMYEVLTGRDRLEFPQMPPALLGDKALILGINDVLLKACQPLPGHRHRSAQAFAAELQLLSQGKSIRRVRHLESALKTTRRFFGSAILMLVCIFLGIEWLQNRREARAMELEREAASALARGNEKVDHGDFIAALSLFARAARLKPENVQENALRLGMTLARIPTVRKLPRSESDVAAVSPDGQFLAVVENCQTVVYEISSIRPLTKIGGNPSFLTFTPKNEIVVVLTNDVVTVNVKTGELTKRHSPEQIRWVSFAESGRSLTTTIGGNVYTEAGDKLFSGTSDIYKAIFSESGRYAALLLKSGEVHIVGVENWTTMVRLEAHNLTVYSAKFSNDDRFVITTGFDRSARCWDLSTGHQVGLRMIHDDAVISASIAQDRSLLATASYDRTVRLWNGEDFSATPENHVLYHPEPVLWCRFLPNYSLISHCVDGSSWLWQLPQNSIDCAEVAKTRDLPTKLASHGRRVAAEARGSNVVAVIDGKELNLSFPSLVSVVAAHPFKPLLAVGTTDDTHAHHALRLLNEAGQTVASEMGHRDGIVFAAFSHFGNRLVSCSEDFTAQIWTTEGKPVGSRLTHSHQVRWAEFSAKDEWVVTGSFDGTARVWNAQTGVAISPPIRIGNLVDFVAFGVGDTLEVGNTRRWYEAPLRVWGGECKQLENLTENPLVLVASGGLP